MARRLEQVASLQREHYEVSRLRFQTRALVFPALFEIKRSYNTAIFDVERAYAFLAKTVLVRKVASTGRISLYGQGYQVGLRYKHQSVSVGFDVVQRAWVFSTQGG